jgi:hypothetical protein
MLKDRPVWAVIPTIGYSELLVPLVNHLEQNDNVDRILLTVNLEEYVEPIKEFFRFSEPNIEIIETWPFGRSLHHGWNVAIEMARQANAWLAVLNDDIELMASDAVAKVAEVMAAHPSYAIVGMNWLEDPENTAPGAEPVRRVHGTYRNHGVGGFAWVCDPLKTDTVPCDFEWWYGDDHLVWSAEDRGYKVGIANHVHVKHVNSLTANSGNHDWIEEAKTRDEISFRRIWPGK